MDWPAADRQYSRRAALLVAGAASLPLSGCRGHSSPSPATSEANAPRVVALSTKDVDACLGCGVFPVGIPRPSFLPDLEPWTRRALDELSGKKPELLDVAGELSLEQVVSLKPDIVLATGHYGLSSYATSLRRIARLVAPVHGPNIDSWIDVTRRVGRLLGRETYARREIRRTLTAIRAASAAAPRLRGKTFTFSAFDGHGQIVTKNDPTDALVQGLAAYGLHLASGVSGLPESGTQGMAQVSVERVRLLEADLTLVLARDAVDRRRYESFDGFARLRSVKRGDYFPITPTHYSALAFPSVLATRWSATHTIPLLDR